MAQRVACHGLCETSVEKPYPKVARIQKRPSKQRSTVVLSCRSGSVQNATAIRIQSQSKSEKHPWRLFMTCMFSVDEFRDLATISRNTLAFPAMCMTGSASSDFAPPNVKMPARPSTYVTVCYQCQGASRIWSCTYHGYFSHLYIHGNTTSTFSRLRLPRSSSPIFLQCSRPGLQSPIKGSPKNKRMTSLVSSVGLLCLRCMPSHAVMVVRWPAAKIQA
ncbi:hypothetical protein GGR54DRAFT_449210 [Hypoxylon sp. NC1633]|nr:hypothetical protein GGR54DRAFT_449210 [Hypoxylon sp. NC1633]